MTKAVALLVALVLASASAQSGECALTYVANAGVLFETNGRKFLFDAPIDDTASQQLRRIEKAAPPFDRITAILTTHWHYDHITAARAAAFLRTSPSTQLVSSQQVIDLVRKEAVTGIAGSQLVAVTPDPGTSARTTAGGVTIHVLRMRHNPSRNFPNEHVGFLVEGCRTVMHSGDADPADDNFMVLRSLPRIDTAILPFWYMQGDNNRQMVASSIRPARVVGIHIAEGDSDNVSRRLASVPNLTLFTNPGMRIQLAK
jgi:L-ascorbate metabolism protein UlaG (beta-lactamase superfamily)